MARDPAADAVLVVDGSGETISSSGWRVRPGGLDLAWTLPFATSLGYAYEAATLFCGHGKYGEGKLMGLEPRSALLDPPVPEAPVPEARPDEKHYKAIPRAWLRHLEQAGGRPRWRPTDPRAYSTAATSRRRHGPRSRATS